jgi:hypothetical protein
VPPSVVCHFEVNQVVRVVLENGWTQTTGEGKPRERDNRCEQSYNAPLGQKNDPPNAKLSAARSSGLFWTTPTIEP